MAEAANLCIAECKLKILFLYEYSTFHLELLTTPILLVMKISLMSSFQALIPDGAGLVCGEIKVGISHAEFYKHRVLTIEVSSLVLLF